MAEAPALAPAAQSEAGQQCVVYDPSFPMTDTSDVRLQGLLTTSVLGLTSFPAVVSTVQPSLRQHNTAGVWAPLVSCCASASCRQHVLSCFHLVIR